MNFIERADIIMPLKEVIFKPRILWKSVSAIFPYLVNPGIQLVFRGSGL